MTKQLNLSTAIPAAYPATQNTLVYTALQYSIELQDLKLAILISEELGQFEPEKKQQILSETLETLIGLTPNDSHRVAGRLYGV